MNLRKSLGFFSHFLSFIWLMLTPYQMAFAQTTTKNCPIPALERFQRHRVGRGETIASIAENYNLSPATIINMNPTLQSGKVTIGSDILIPPYNGIIIAVSNGETWGQIASRYKVRADALFEINGCKPPSKFAFVPVVQKSANPNISRVNINTSPGDSSQIKLVGYPLPNVSKTTLPYGWQINPQTGDVFFHSGIDLVATVGTPVNSLAAGTVVFAGFQDSYGNLVVINHDGGLQTRYAQLESIRVSVGQRVKIGEIIGNVGTTGQPTSKQPHLHFEVRSSSSLGWKAQDPKTYLQK
ncbi:LysM peptidoglycan-binding domain-containing M23 family metallopeptidase [Calothrix sp. 336/3]|uniref:LysM peptidoglycan-binding domain-containing M23 family metallopeptidase n=2 Tax=Calothrix sp. 336/3 TaxID=1337936 RepID=UPI0004E3EF76|nr:peptidase [Calothrix sp. 336/3]